MQILQQKKTNEINIEDCNKETKSGKALDKHFNIK